MKIIIAVLSTMFCFGLANVFAQAGQKHDTVAPKFENQGEQEVYWARQFFKREYKEQKFERFKGTIISVDDTIVFLKDTLSIFNTDAELKAIFLNGILYPALIGGNRISDIEELKTADLPPQKKRFALLLYHKLFLNPTKCFFELKNEQATASTGLTEFIKNANLTFFKLGWIMI